MAARLLIRGCRVIRYSHSPQVAIRAQSFARAYPQAHRHMLDAADEARAHPLDRPGQLDRLETLGEVAEHHLQFEPGEICTEAEMLADAEGNVTIGITADIESIRRGENALVAVRRRIEQRDGIALANLMAVERRV